MSLTTAQAFDSFYNLVSLDSATLAAVSQRRGAVETVLRQAFPSTSTMKYQSSYLMGSMAKRTASRPFNDVDLMVHIKVDDALWARTYQRNSSEFLNRVRRVLNDASAVKKIGARGQAVRMFYADGLSVDVAAVVKYPTSGYGIPSGTGTWLTTDPPVSDAYINRRSTELGNNLKRLIIFAKQWNKAHSSRLSSFHLELLAARTFSTLGTNRREALRIFFDYNAFNVSVYDPAGHSGDVSSYLSWSTRDEVGRSMTAARDRADLALAAEARGNHTEAKRHWAIILGPRFPQD